MSKKPDIVVPEWSHPVDVNDISGSLEVSISADEESRKNLANRLGLLSLDQFNADYTLLRADNSAAVHVRGEFEAMVIQACVVSGKPVLQNVSESFEAWFEDKESAVSLVRARREREMKDGHAEVQILDEQEDPDPVIDGKIDLGECAAQYLSLSIPPYPKAEGEEWDLKQEDDPERHQDLTNNPFAALKNWKDKQGMA